MRFFIRNKLMSFGGSSEVLDENEQLVYKVKGKVFSISRKKFLYDMEGNLKYIIRNKVFKFFLPSVLIYDSQKKKIARLKRKFSLKESFYLTGYKDELKIEGDFIGRDYQVYRNGNLAAKIQMKFLTLADCFTLDVEDGEDSAFLASLVIGIDNIFDERKENRR